MQVTTWYDITTINKVSVSSMYSICNLLNLWNFGVNHLWYDSIFFYSLNSSFEGVTLTSYSITLLRYACWVCRAVIYHIMLAMLFIRWYYSLWIYTVLCSTMDQHALIYAHLTEVMTDVYVCIWFILSKQLCSKVVGQSCNQLELS